MRKNLFLFITIGILTLLPLSVNAQEITIKVNDEIITTDTEPVIVNDRVLVPLRAISSALSFDVAWDSDNKGITVTNGYFLSSMWIGRDTAFKTDGVSLVDAYKMDSLPTIINDRTMVPIRCIAELFGATVDWIPDEKTVTVTLDNTEALDEEISAEQLSIYTDYFYDMYDEYSDYSSEKKNVILAEIELENGGIIKLELYDGIAPRTVANFVKLANEKAFDGKIFHRVINDFMIQGGAYNEKNEIQTKETILGEFLFNSYFNLIPHTRGTISMARTNDPNSASNQFFIVHKDSYHLNGYYAAFGMVYEGMEYVDEIAKEKVDENDKPIKNQVIKTIKIINND